MIEDQIAKVSMYVGSTHKDIQARDKKIYRSKTGTTLCNAEVEEPARQGEISVRETTVTAIVEENTRKGTGYTKEGHIAGTKAGTGRAKEDIKADINIPMQTPVGKDEDKTESSKAAGKIRSYTRYAEAEDWWIPTPVAHAAGKQVTKLKIVKQGREFSKVYYVLGEGKAVRLLGHYLFAKVRVVDERIKSETVGDKMATSTMVEKAKVRRRIEKSEDVEKTAPVGEKDAVATNPSVEEAQSGKGKGDVVDEAVACKYGRGKNLREEERDLGDEAEIWRTRKEDDENKEKGT